MLIESNLNPDFNFGFERTFLRKLNELPEQKIAFWKLKNLKTKEV